MKTERNIQQLMLKFIQEECSPKEVEEILEYVKSVKGIEGMPSFEDVLSLLEEVPDMEHGRAQAIYSHIIKEEKKRPITAIRNRLIRYASAAAVLIGMLTLGYLYQQGTFDTGSKNLLIPANESITLQLEDGTIEMIDPEASKGILNGKGNVVGNQNKSQLTYASGENAGELAYHKLTVPYGKRFDIVLSDGTTVYLNSGTELRYPVSFLSQGNREVFVKGEAFFDVTRDVERPFIVNAAELNVEVLGTEFNVLAYPEDGITDVVLVEGSVGLSIENSGENEILSPGEKGVVDRMAGTIVTQEVNTDIYTAWRDGILVFRNMPFKNLIKKLERQYNIAIVNENKALGEEIFNASFNEEPLEKILEYLNTSYNIDYTIKNNTIYIK